MEAVKFVPLSKPVRLGSKGVYLFIKSFSPMAPSVVEAVESFHSAVTSPVCQGFKGVYFFSPLWSMEPYVMEAVKFVQLTSPERHGYKGVYLLILVPCGVWSLVSWKR